MARTIWSNLDFEYALRYGSLWRPPAAMLGRLHAWRYLLRCMPDYEEATLWSRGEPRSQDLLVWGEDGRASGEVAGEGSPARRANDRLTLYALEPPENMLPCRALVTSSAQLEALLVETPHDWIIKHPLGVSGRERITGVAGAIDPRQRTWLERRLEEGDTLVFEPRCAIEEEFSWHVDVLAQGELRVRGRCTLLVDAQGTHRGHIVTQRGLARDHDLPEVIAQTLRALHEETGYEGPLSTDGFVGTLAGRPAKIERFISEINARHSFGRMALELARGALNAPERALVWWHFTQRELKEDKNLISKIKNLKPYPDSSAPRERGALQAGWYRLPERVDPGGETGTALCLTGEEGSWEHDPSLTLRPDVHQLLIKALTSPR